jgi:hypothetical protein
MPLDMKALASQADYALNEWQNLRARSKHDDCSDQPDSEVTRVLSLVAATIERLAPSKSHYSNASAELLKRYGPDNPYVLKNLPGVLLALRSDLASGRMQPVSEMIHGELFGDMLEGANYLRSEGWKDPAAVIAGSVLEEHLRQLCAKYGVAVDKDSVPRKADALNADLAKAGAYEKLDQKNVTAWLDLRNKAAHGEYGAYTTEQVALMIDGIRNFITRRPA